MRPCVADDAHEPVGELLGGARHASSRSRAGSSRRPGSPSSTRCRGRPGRRQHAEEHHRAGREQARDRCRNGARREQDTMPASTAIASSAPRPSGTACRRTSSGASTASTSGSSRRSLERAPRPLEQQRVAGAEHRLVRALSPRRALHGEDDEVAARRSPCRGRRSRRSAPSAAGSRPRRRPDRRVSSSSGS